MEWKWWWYIHWKIVGIAGFYRSSNRCWNTLIICPQRNMCACKMIELNKTNIIIAGRNSNNIRCRSEYIALRNKLIRCQELVESILNQFRAHWMEIHHSSGKQHDRTDLHRDNDLMIEIFGMIVIQQRMIVNTNMCAIGEGAPRLLALSWVYCTLCIKKYSYLYTKIRSNLFGSCALQSCTSSWLVWSSRGSAHIETCQIWWQKVNRLAKIRHKPWTRKF